MHSWMALVHRNYVVYHLNYSKREQEPAPAAKAADTRNTLVSLYW